MSPGKKMVGPVRSRIPWFFSSCKKDLLGLMLFPPLLPRYLFRVNISNSLSSIQWQMIQHTHFSFTIIAKNQSWEFWIVNRNKRCFSLKIIDCWPHWRKIKVNWNDQQISIPAKIQSTIYLQPNFVKSGHQSHLFENNWKSNCL